MSTRPMPTLPLTQLRAGANLAKKLASAIDVDKDDDVSDEELARIKVRDGFVARNLMASAATVYTDTPPTVDSMQDSIERAVRSAQRADADKDGTLTPAEWKKASKTARLLARFAEKYAGAKLSAFKVKPWEKPGSTAWVKLAQTQYHDSSDTGRPRFGTALVVAPAALPAAVRTQYRALEAQFPQGKVEACTLLVNGAPVTYMHSLEDSIVHTALVSTTGTLLSTGVYTPTGAPRFGHYRWVGHWTAAGA